MAKKRKRASKASESKAKLDGDLKVERADEELEDGVHLGEGGYIKNATVTVPADEPEKKSRGFAEDAVSESAGNQPIEEKPKFTPVKKAPVGKVACVAIGTRVLLKNKRGYSVEADVIGVDEGFVTFRVLGSDAKLQKLEAEVLADLQRGGRIVRMEF